MATTEDDPIFVASEDEADDYDDVVVIKEEPPVPDDDVIFVSETKGENKGVSSSVPGDSVTDPLAVDSACDGTVQRTPVVQLPTSPVSCDADLKKALEDMIGNGVVSSISPCFVAYCCYGDQDNQKANDTVSASGPSQTDTVSSLEKNADDLNQSNSNSNILGLVGNTISLSESGASTDQSHSSHNAPTDFSVASILNGISNDSQQVPATSNSTILTTQNSDNVVMLSDNLNTNLVVPVTTPVSSDCKGSTVVVSGNSSAILASDNSTGDVLLVADSSQSQISYGTDVNTKTENFQQCVDLLMQFQCQYKCISSTANDVLLNSTTQTSCSTNNVIRLDQTLSNTSKNQKLPVNTSTVPSNQSMSVCTFQPGLRAQAQNVTTVQDTSQTPSSSGLQSTSNTEFGDDKLLSSILDEMFSPAQDTQLHPVLSHSSDLSQDSLPPRKRYRYNMDSSGCNSTLVPMSTGIIDAEKDKDIPKVLANFCFKCLQTNLKLVVYCVKGHSFCDICVQDLAKQMLLDKTKSMKCLKEECGSTYSIGELKKSLPEMVIDILEKREIENIGEWIASSVNDKKPARNPDLPEHWESFDERSTLKVVELDNDSIEFLNVAIKFFDSMDGKRCYIHRVSRVQNLTLWKYYALKKIEMLHENDGIDVNEEKLFHGTQSHCVEAISRKGFDWRVCGKHGTLYGEGCYFAKNARYSHDYTDYHTYKQQKRASSKRRIRLNSSCTGILLNKPGSSWRPPPAHNQSPYFSSPNLNSNLAHQNIPPPAHQLLSNSNCPTTNFQQLMNPYLQYPYFSTLVPNLTQNTVSQSSTLSTLQTTFNDPPQRPLTTRSISTPETSGKKDPENLLKMFLSSVLVGKSTGGQRGFRKPPPLFPESDAMGRCYDSCVDDIFDPKIWVIFDSHQSYPEYLVEYTSSELMDYSCV